ncbi:origin recognition complex subunit 3 N-terminus-domain-containing protein [Dipodascopsis tothii]|uniref:origin recognition complex subunit 3 N-terminus-domain-containing protein n=1 Tax=Dipodascopsis tothii TaxID=44089 RepID=UPI0034CE8E39
MKRAEEDVDRDTLKTCYFVPRKRRRAHAHPFVPLSESVPEAAEHVALRWEAYQAVYGATKAKLEAVVRESSQATMDSVSQYISEVTPYSHESGRMHLGMVVAGSNIADHARLFSALIARLDADHATVSLSSKDGSTLRMFLKGIILQVIKTYKDFALEDGDENVIVTNSRGTVKNDRRANYDFSVLEDWTLRLAKPRKIVIVVQDADSFDADILAELIRVLHAYSDRIPFVLLLGVATMLTIFNAKLPKSVLRLVEVRRFDIVRVDSSVSRLVDKVILADDTAFTLGPDMARLLYGRFVNCTKSLTTYTSAVHYAHMVHFYSNPLALVLHPDTDRVRGALTPAHYRALRMQPSFMYYVSSVLKHEPARAADLVPRLLEHDAEVFQLLASSRAQLGKLLGNVKAVLRLLEIIARADTYWTTLSGTKSKIELFSDVMTAAFVDSQFYREIPSLLQNLSAAAADKFVDDVLAVFEETSELHQMALAWRAPDPAPRRGDAARPPLSRTISAAVEAFLKASIRSYRNVPFHELFLFDRTELYERAFTTYSRAAVESALNKPHEYLGPIAVPDGEPDRIARQQPLLAIAYSLYRESGTMINVYDFWRAFHQSLHGGAVLQAVDPNREGAQAASDDAARDAAEKKSLAWFYNAIAELKFLGFVKGTVTRRGGGHRHGKESVSVAVLQKLAWEGL